VLLTPNAATGAATEGDFLFFNSGVVIFPLAEEMPSLLLCHFQATKEYSYASPRLSKESHVEENLLVGEKALT
jgi:hypothetical protein